MSELDNIVDLSSVQFTATPGRQELATSDTYGVVAQKAKAINAKMLNTEDLSSTSSFDVKDLQLYGGGQDFRLGSIADRNTQFSPTSTFGASDVEKKEDTAVQASSTSFGLSDFKITPMKANSDIFSSTSSSRKLSEIEYGSQGGGAKMKAQKLVKRGGNDDSDSSSSSSSSSSSQDGGNDDLSTSFTFGSSFLRTSSNKRGGKTSKTFITGSRRLPGTTATSTPRIDDEPAYLLSDSASSLKSFGSDWGADSESSDYSTLLKA
jgi:hypothetical protein